MTIKSRGFHVLFIYFGARKLLCGNDLLVSCRSGRLWKVVFDYGIVMKRVGWQLGCRASA
jgi:hypothetical protein